MLFLTHLLSAIKSMWFNTKPKSDNIWLTTVFQLIKRYKKQNIALCCTKWQCIVAMSYQLASKLHTTFSRHYLLRVLMLIRLVLYVCTLSGNDCLYITTPKTYSWFSSRFKPLYDGLRKLSLKLNNLNTWKCNLCRFKGCFTSQAINLSLCSTSFAYETFLTQHSFSYG